MPRGEYLAAPEKIHASKYLLLTAIEDSLAVANHVIASEAYRAPTDYADAFTSLAEGGVLPIDLATKLGAMARFRNLLVHEYARIDDVRTHELLGTDIEDLAEFLQLILDAFGDLRDA